MESLLIFIIFLIILGVVLYPLWLRWRGTSCGPCGLPSIGTGTCFPSSQIPVKSGIIDLRRCSDDVYILGDRTKVHFVSEI